jgi:hypothetical protein
MIKNWKRNAAVFTAGKHNHRFLGCKADLQTTLLTSNGNCTYTAFTLSHDPVPKAAVQM